MNQPIGAHRASGPHTSPAKGMARLIASAANCRVPAADGAAKKVLPVCRTGRLTVIDFVNPAGFAPPLHRHLEEDELFYVLSGTARFHCDGETFAAGPGDFVLLPVGLPHSFVVGPDEPLRALQISTPSGFEGFVAAVGEPAHDRRLPEPGPVDAAALGHAAARHAIELLGPPPGH